MQEELHIAECGAWLGSSHCGHKQTLISEKVATEYLTRHLLDTHHYRVDPDTSSETYFGWVYPLPERRPAHWVKPGKDGEPLGV